MMKRTINLILTLSAIIGCLVGSVKQNALEQSTERTRHLEDYGLQRTSLDKVYASGVNNSVLFVDQNAMGNNDGSSWENAFIDLQDAIAIASDSDSIFVSEGTYLPTTTNNPAISFFISEDIVLLGGFSVTNGATTLPQRDPALYETTLSGDISSPGVVTDNSLTVVRTSEARAVIDGFTIRDGYADIANGEPSSDQGGGLFLRSNTVILRNLIVENNYAVESGGGLYMTRGVGSPISDVTIINCTFQNNHSDEDGGGLYSAGQADNLTVINSLFLSNYAREDGGGGLVFSTPNTNFTNVEFRANQADGSGGGLEASVSNGTLTNVLFSGNYATAMAVIGAGVGGGLSISNGSVFDVINCTFTGNRANSAGGGLFIGGGSAGNSTVNLRNSLIWNNIANGNANDNTVSESVFNVIIGGVSRLNYSNSLIQHSNCSTTCYTRTGSSDEGNNKDVDPIFTNDLNPATAPSTVGNFTVNIGSPTIDMGDNASLPMGVSTDLNGISRVQGATVDIGAYETPDDCINPITLYVDANATGTGTGFSWANAFTDLQDALNYCAYDSIFVSQGTYYPDGTNNGSGTGDRDTSFNIPDDITLLGGFNTAAGDTTLNSRDWEVNRTILSGNIGSINDSIDNSYHVVRTGDTVTAVTVVDGFIICDGVANGSDNDDKSGAGWRNEGSPSLSNILFTNNRAEFFGGGMFNTPNASPSLFFVRFWENSAVFSGGGLEVGPGSTPIVVENSSFRGNMAQDGGGLRVFQAPILLINNEFSGNVASRNGGAVAVSESDADIVNSTFASNSASDSGGAIAHFTFGTPIDQLDVVNSIFFNNTAATNQAVYTQSGNTTNVSFSLFQQATCPTNTDCTGGGNIFASDPQFVLNPSTAPSADGNLSLQNTSPAINMGDLTVYNTTGGPTIDLDSSQRIVEGQIDMGAYEVLTCLDATILYVDAAASGEGTGLSWSDAFTDLQDALAYTCSYDTILVNQGTYYPDGSTTGAGSGARDTSFNIPSGKVVLGGFNVQGGVTELGNRSPRLYPTILNGEIGDLGLNTDNSEHVVTFFDADGTTVLDGFVISNGYADIGGGSLGDNDRNRGGGILLDNSDAQLNELYINNNFSSREGGGIAIVNGSNPMITNTTIIDNEGRDGGGMLTRNNSNPMIINVSILSNIARHGGGIFNDLSSPTIQNTIIQGNIATEGGGGIENYQSGGDYNNVLISGNSTPNDGGGMSNILDSSPKLTNVTISGNSAGGGGDDHGGGIYNQVRSSPIINNSIIYNNRQSNVTNTLSASIFNEPNVDDPSTPTLTNSIVQNAVNGSGDLNGAIGVDGGNNKDVDPGFVQPINPATNTSTIGGDYSLINLSPAIDMGDSTLYNGDVLDLAGKDRIQVLNIDMGAYEVELIPCSSENIPVLYVDQYAAPGGDGLSWATAFTEVQTALNYHCPYDSIFVSKGSYFTSNSADRLIYFDIPGNVILMGGFDAQNGITDPADRDWTAYPTILSANIGDPSDATDNSHHVILINNTNGSEINGFVIQDGYATGGNTFSRNKGGGILCISGGSAVFKNNRIQNNFAGADGGGLALMASNTGLFENNIFRNNRTNGDGGGARIENTNFNPAIFINSQFSGNQANGDGGAIGTLGIDDSLVIINSTISGNSAGRDGGALFAPGFGVFLANSIIWNNSAGGETNLEISSIVSGGSSGNFDIASSVIANFGGSNAWTGPADWNAGGNLDEDPIFILDLDPTNAPSDGGDFGLQNLSPAINAGDGVWYPVSAPNLDLIENQRIADGGIDMGAYENPCGLVSFNLYVDQSAESSGDGLTWNTAFIDLQDALNFACLVDTIFVAQGTYTPDGGTDDPTRSFDLLDNLVLLGGFPSGGGTLMERNWKNNLTILSGEIGTSSAADNSLHVLTIVDVDNVYLDGFEVSGGHARGTFPDNVGGGIYIEGQSPVLSNLTIQSNQSTSSGGGIFARNGIELTIYNSILKNNYSDIRGGGGAFQGIRLIMINTVVKGNAAGLDGGGMRLLTSNGTSRIINSTISGNKVESGNGGGIQVNAVDIILANSIVWNNSAGGGNTTSQSASIDNANRTVTVSNSIVQNSGGSTGWLFVDQVVDNGNNKDEDPQFIAAANPLSAPNSIGNLRPESTSPAIDMGDDALYLSNGYPETDLDNEMRIVGTTINMGAYETFSCPANSVLFVDTSAAGTGDGLSWVNAFRSLQDALLYPCPVDSIYVSAGVYYPNIFNNAVDTISGMRDTSFQVPDGVVLLGGFPNGGGSLTERDYLCHRTILSGEISPTENSYHVVQTKNVSAATLIDGFIIRGGLANGAGSGQLFGGGFFNLADSTNAISSPHLNNILFINNSAAQAGGGFASLAANGGTAYPVLTNVAFSDNSAQQGGALAAIGSTGTDSTTIINGVFTYNSADAGGAVFAESNVNAQTAIRITNSSFVGNRSLSEGGAIAYTSLFSPSVTRLYVANSLFDGNETFAGADNNIEIVVDPLIITPGQTPAADIDFCIFDDHCPLPADCDANTQLNISSNIKSIEDALADQNYSGNITFFPASPIIDRGSNALYIGPPDDQQGNARTVDGDHDQTSTIDIGAHEIVPDPCDPFTGAIIYVDSMATGANTGLNWTDAFTNLQKALQVARCNAIDSIFVSAGIYYPSAPDSVMDRCSGAFVELSPADPTDAFFLSEGMVLMGGFPSGGGTRNPTLHKTTLSGDIDMNGDTSGNSYHVMAYFGGLDTVVIDGFELTGGNAPNLIDFITPYEGAGNGGGLYVEAINEPANLKLRNMAFYENYAFNDGGGLYHVGSDQSSQSSLILENVIFERNASLDDDGGAMLVEVFDTGFVDLTLAQVGFYGNAAHDDGGSMELGAESSGASIQAFVVNGVYSNNVAGSDGGAINIDSDEGDHILLSVINSTFWANQAGSDGGAIDFEQTSAISDLMVSNAIFFENESTDNAGNIFYTNNGGTFGDFSYILTDESEADICGMDQDNFACGAGIIFDSNPLFIDPDGLDNIPGTADDNLRLKASSLAVDAGLNDPALGVTIDFDQLPRLVNGTVDLGANEYRCQAFVGTVIYVDSSAAAGGNGSSWTSAFKDLYDAFRVLDCNNVDTILVAQGTYYPDGGSGDPQSAFIVNDQLVILGGYSPSGVSRDWETYQTILSGDIGIPGDGTDNSLEVLQMDDADSHIDGLFIKDGRTSFITVEAGLITNCQVEE